MPWVPSAGQISIISWVRHYKLAIAHCVLVVPHHLTIIAVIWYYRERKLFIVKYTTISNRPKSSSGKVHIPATIRMSINFSWAVAAIDQSAILLIILSLSNRQSRSVTHFGAQEVWLLYTTGSKVPNLLAAFTAHNETAIDWPCFIVLGENLKFIDALYVSPMAF